MRLHPHYLWKDLFHKKDEAQLGLIAMLRENVLFRTLTGRELAYLSHLVYERVYQTDEGIFQQSDRGIGMYMISKGSVSIKTHGVQGEVLITTLGQGSFFGELALVEPDNIRSASATALEPTTVIGFFKPDLLEILERKPAMGVKILFQLSTVLGKRLLKTTEKITLVTRAQGIAEIYDDAV